jgi:diketogulonate reductase-like aldo/keto reductase
VERSLAVFGTTYVDLVLLHYPRCFPGVCTSAEITRTEKDGGWREAWRALGTLAASGVVRARGASNFNLDEVFTTV